MSNIHTIKNIPVAPTPQRPPQVPPIAIPDGQNLQTGQTPRTPTSMAYQRQLTETIRATTSWTKKIGWATRILTAVQVFLYFLTFLPLNLVEKMCLPSPDAFGLFGIYRLFTFSWFHGGILHILFNMIAFVSLGTIVEKKKIGTVNLLFWTVGFLGFCIGMLDQVLTAGWIMIKSFFQMSSSSSCTIGMSGVIFAFIVAADDLKFNCFSATSESRPLFCINIPKHFYPWALLLIIQFIFPNASAFGHISGILLGYALSAYPRIFCLPAAVSSRLESLLPEFITNDAFAYSSLDDVFETDALPTHRPLGNGFPGAGTRLGGQL